MAARPRARARRGRTLRRHMSVLDRKELEQSPLADLHAIASELGVEGYRRLRKEELIGAILEGQDGGGGEPEDAEPEPGDAEAEQVEAAEEEGEPEAEPRGEEP